MFDSKSTENFEKIRVDFKLYSINSNKPTKKHDFDSTVNDINNELFGLDKIKNIFKGFNKITDVNIEIIKNLINPVDNIYKIQILLNYIINLIFMNFDSVFLEKTSLFESNIDEKYIEFQKEFLLLSLNKACNFSNLLTFELDTKLILNPYSPPMWVTLKKTFKDIKKFLITNGISEDFNNFVFEKLIDYFDLYFDYFPCEKKQKFEFYNSNINNKVSKRYFCVPFPKNQERKLVDKFKTFTHIDKHTLFNIFSFSNIKLGFKSKAKQLNLKKINSILKSDESKEFLNLLIKSNNSTDDNLRLAFDELLKLRHRKK